MGEFFRIFAFIGAPFGYLFKFTYEVTGHYLWALALFCIIIKLLMLPLNIKQQKSAQKQARLRPKEQQIRDKYKNKTDQESQSKMSQEIMKMYSENGYNPASGCLPTLIQMPVLFSLYAVITKPLTYICGLDTGTISTLEQKVHEIVGNSSSLTQIQMISVIKENPIQFADFIAETTLPEFGVFGNMIDLSQVPTFSHVSWVLLIPVLTLFTSYIATFIRSKLMKRQQLQAENEAMQSMQTMQYIMPLMSVWITFSVPAIIGIYWIMQNIFDVAQQFVLYKVFPIEQSEKKER